MNTKRTFQKTKNLYHLVKAVIANIYFLFPSRKIIIVGVTGTNGKTTTAQMIGKVLEATGKKVAVYSTINFKIGKEERINKTKFTTQSAWFLQKFIKKAVQKGCHYLVLETSSHALDQFRVWGVDYNMAVITNITREHLDYHFTDKAYQKTKLKLFKTTANSWGRTNRIGIINRNIEKYQDFLFSKMKANYLYYSGKKLKMKVDKYPIWRADKIKLNKFKSEFEVDGTKFKLNLPGKVNVENALAAICVGVSQKIPGNKIKKQLLEIKKIPGRMEMVENNKGIKIIIDYALTPDSMQKLGKFVEEIKDKNSRLVWVFGSCGDRDRGKRPMMGKVVEKFADLIITTNEDPYREDPKQILEEIEKGIKNKKKLLRIMDREEALRMAIEKSEKGDIVLVSGKGAEENMMIGKKKISWNDKKIIRNILDD